MENLNDVITVTKKLYYEANPDTKMDVPSYAYERVEQAQKRQWMTAGTSLLTLYDFCKYELDNWHNQINKTIL